MIPTSKDSAGEMKAFDDLAMKMSVKSRRDESEEICNKLTAQTTIRLTIRP